MHPPTRDRARAAASEQRSDNLRSSPADAQRFNPECAKAAEGRTLRFLANVDPVDVKRALEGLEAETTLGDRSATLLWLPEAPPSSGFPNLLHCIWPRAPAAAAAPLRARASSGNAPTDSRPMSAVVICSKTMTTAETILNAKTVRSWIVSALGEGPQL